MATSAPKDLRPDMEFGASPVEILSISKDSARLVAVIVECSALYHQTYFQLLYIVGYKYQDSNILFQGTSLRSEDGNDNIKLEDIELSFRILSPLKLC